MSICRESDVCDRYKKVSTPKECFGSSEMFLGSGLRVLALSPKFFGGELYNQRVKLYLLFKGVQVFWADFERAT